MLCSPPADVKRKTKRVCHNELLKLYQGRKEKLNFLITETKKKKKKKKDVSLYSAYSSASARL